tara:strand:+ start:1044 stop:1349 length:306 start_codon:yes stop_codon:yes gene_type:complete
MKNRNIQTGDKNMTEQYFYNKLKTEGSKRWTIPMDKMDHLDNTVKVIERLLDALKKVQKQRIPGYLRLLHARNAIEDANYSTKLLANEGDDTAHKSYKGAV